MVCGFGEEVAYETLVSKLAGASVDKSSRFTDWARRPLSDGPDHTTRWATSPTCA